MSDQSQALSSAIDVLTCQLEKQLREANETKKAINAVRRAMGLEALYTDLDVDAGSSLTVRPDQYYGRPLATAAQEYLDRKKQACQADEILKALEQGGFDFKGVGWKDQDRLRNLAVTLSKNTKTFHRLPNGTFGLLSWYDQAMLKRAERANGDKERPAQEPKPDQKQEAEVQEDEIAN